MYPHARKGGRCVRVCGDNDGSLGSALNPFRSKQEHRAADSYHAIRCTPLRCSINTDGREWDSNIACIEQKESQLLASLKIECFALSQ
jgi:hypothetical protein